MLLSVALSAFYALTTSGVAAQNTEPSAPKESTKNAKKPDAAKSAKEKASPRDAIATSKALRAPEPAVLDKVTFDKNGKPVVSEPDAPPSAKGDAKGKKIPPSFPKTLEEAKAEAEAAKLPPDVWAPETITAAKEQCAEILKRINAVAIYQEPVKQGECGAPAPIQLISIGKNPEVSISPPATMTCALADGLSRWLENDLQPLARKHLGAEIIKIENMSSYACRNAYGRTSTKLSEHGLANALDIRGFVTSTAQTAYVLEHWGTPQREILARIAAEKAAAEKAAAERAAADKAAQENQLANKNGNTPIAPPAASGSSLGAPAAGIARGTVQEGVPKVTVTLPGAKPKTEKRTSKEKADSENSAHKEPALLTEGPSPNASSKRVKIAASGKSVTLTVPDALIGDSKGAKKKSAEKFSASSIEPDPSSRGPKPEFLRAAQAAACRIFGTTLGPEANAAHRNHFHVDM
ncbi:MAG: hypothetical protein CTY39_04360, partial [Hyphomicrobium sp.]